MYWVQFSDIEEGKTERTYFQSLQYAKRFADLYKDNHIRTEVGTEINKAESIIETFQRKTIKKEN